MPLDNPSSQSHHPSPSRNVHCHGLDNENNGENNNNNRRSNNNNNQQPNNKPPPIPTPPSFVNKDGGEVDICPPPAPSNNKIRLPILRSKIIDTTLSHPGGPLVDSQNIPVVKGPHGFPQPPNNNNNEKGKGEERGGGSGDVLRGATFAALGEKVQDSFKIPKSLQNIVVRHKISPCENSASGTRKRSRNNNSPIKSSPQQLPPSNANSNSDKNSNLQTLFYRGVEMKRVDAKQTLPTPASTSGPYSKASTLSKSKTKTGGGGSNPKGSSNNNEQVNKSSGGGTNNNNKGLKRKSVIVEQPSSRPAKSKGKVTTGTGGSGTQGQGPTKQAGNGRLEGTHQQTGGGAGGEGGPHSQTYKTLKEFLTMPPSAPPLLNLGLGGAGGETEQQQTTTSKAMTPGSSQPYYKSKFWEYVDPNKPAPKEQHQHGQRKGDRHYDTEVLKSFIEKQKEVRREKELAEVKERQKIILKKKKQLQQLNERARHLAATALGGGGMTAGGGGSKSVKAKGPLQPISKSKTSGGGRPTADPSKSAQQQQQQGRGGRVDSEANKEESTDKIPTKLFQPQPPMTEGGGQVILPPTLSSSKSKSKKQLEEEQSPIPGRLYSKTRKEGGGGELGVGGAVLHSSSSVDPSSKPGASVKKKSSGVGPVPSTATGSGGTGAADKASSLLLQEFENIVKRECINYFTHGAGAGLRTQQLQTPMLVDCGVATTDSLAELNKSILSTTLSSQRSGAKEKSGTSHNHNSSSTSSVLCSVKVLRGGGGGEEEDGKSSPAVTLENYHSAASRIQAAFKGYKERKILREAHLLPRDLVRVKKVFQLQTVGLERPLLLSLSPKFRAPEKPYDRQESASMTTFFQKRKWAKEQMGGENYLPPPTPPHHQLLSSGATPILASRARSSHSTLIQSATPTATPTSTNPKKTNPSQPVQAPAATFGGLELGSRRKSFNFNEPYPKEAIQRLLEAQQIEQEAAVSLSRRNSLSEIKKCGSLFHLQEPRLVVASPATTTPHSRPLSGMVGGGGVDTTPKSKCSIPLTTRGSGIAQPPGPTISAALFEKLKLLHTQEDKKLGEGRGWEEEVEEDHIQALDKDFESISSILQYPRSGGVAALQSQDVSSITDDYFGPSDSDGGVPHTHHHTRTSTPINSSSLANINKSLNSPSSTNPPTEEQESNNTNVETDEELVGGEEGGHKDDDTLKESSIHRPPHPKLATTSTTTTSTTRGGSFPFLPVPALKLAYEAEQERLTILEKALEATSFYEKKTNEGGGGGVSSRRQPPSQPLPPRVQIPSTSEIQEIAKRVAEERFKVNMAELEKEKWGALIRQQEAQQQQQQQGTHPPPSSPSIANLQLEMMKCHQEAAKASVEVSKWMAEMGKSLLQDRHHQRMEEDERLGAAARSQQQEQTGGQSHHGRMMDDPVNLAAIVYAAVDEAQRIVAKERRRRKMERNKDKRGGGGGGGSGLEEQEQGVVHPHQQREQLDVGLQCPSVNVSSSDDHHQNKEKEDEEYNEQSPLDHPPQDESGGENYETVEDKTASTPEIEEEDVPQQGFSLTLSPVLNMSSQSPESVSYQLEEEDGQREGQQISVEGEYLEPAEEEQPSWISSVLSQEEEEEGDKYSESFLSEEQEKGQKKELEETEEEELNPENKETIPQLKNMEEDGQKKGKEEISSAVEEKELESVEEPASWISSQLSHQEEEQEQEEAEKGALVVGEMDDIEPSAPEVEVDEVESRNKKLGEEESTEILTGEEEGSWVSSHLSQEEDGHKASEPTPSSEDQEKNELKELVGEILSMEPSPSPPEELEKVEEEEQTTGGKISEQVEEKESFENQPVEMEEGGKASESFLSSSWEREQQQQQQGQDKDEEEVAVEMTNIAQPTLAPAATSSVVPPSQGTSDGSDPLQGNTEESGNNPTHFDSVSSPPSLTTQPIQQESEVEEDSEKVKETNEEEMGTPPPHPKETPLIQDQDKSELLEIVEQQQRVEEEIRELQAKICIPSTTPTEGGGVEQQLEERDVEEGGDDEKSKSSNDAIQDYLAALEEEAALSLLLHPPPPPLPLPHEDQSTAPDTPRPGMSLAENDEQVEEDGSTTTKPPPPPYSCQPFESLLYSIHASAREGRVAKSARIQELVTEEVDKMWPRWISHPGRLSNSFYSSGKEVEREIRASIGVATTTRQQGEDKEGAGQPSDEEEGDENYESQQDGFFGGPSSSAQEEMLDDEENLERYRIYLESCESLSLRYLVRDCIRRSLRVEELHTAMGYVDTFRRGAFALTALESKVPKTRDQLISAVITLVHQYETTSAGEYDEEGEGEIEGSGVDSTGQEEHYRELIEPLKNARLKWNCRPRDVVENLLVGETLEEEPQWLNIWPEALQLTDEFSDKIIQDSLRQTIRNFEIAFDNQN